MKKQESAVSLRSCISGLPGGPEVKSPGANAGCGFNPWLGAEVPPVSRPENQNIKWSNTVTYSIKTYKIICSEQILGKNEKATTPPDLTDIHKQLSDLESDLTRVT